MTEETTQTRDDGPYENVFLNVGTKGDRSAYTRAVTPRLLQYTELEGLYEGDGFARRIIDLPAEEMVRAGYDIEGVDDDSDVRAELEGVQALEKLCDAMRWANLYGGSLVVMLINDGGTLEDPLNIENSKSLEQLRVYDRWQVTHYRKYLDPNDMRFGKTELYMVSPIEGTPYIVHESRCLVFDGVPVPDRIRERNDGWGASKLQQCYDQLTRFGMGHYWANQLLERAQQAIHGIPELTNLLRSPGGEALVKKRVDLVDMTRSINNTIVIDSAETYDLKSTPLSGVADIMDRLGLALSAVTGIPESLLFGRQQGGLNSTGKADLENWYAKIGQDQNNILLPALDKLVTVQLYVMGRYVEDYLIKFNPLSVPSRKDVAETDYKRAQTFEILNNIGALDASEIRKMLPDEGYDIDDVETPPETEVEEPFTGRNDYSPSQPREKNGRWKDTGAGGAGASLEDQTRAVDAYISGDALPLNQALRDGREVEGELKQMKAGLDSYLEKGETFEKGQRLYRAVHSEQAEELAALPVGSVYVDKGYTSTTKSLNSLNQKIIPEIEDLGELHVMQISVIGGSRAPGRSVEHSSGYFKGQQEFLFQRGTSFVKVSEEVRPDGIRVSSFKVIDD